MSQIQPGIRISVENQIMTPEMRSKLKEMAADALGIVQSLQLSRLIIADVEDVLEGDGLSLISLMTNIILLVARLKMISDAVIAKHQLLVAQQGLMALNIRRLAGTL